MNGRWRRFAIPSLLSTVVAAVLLFVWLWSGSQPSASAPRASGSPSPAVVASATATATPEPTPTPAPAATALEAKPPPPEWEVTRPARNLSALAARFGRLDPALVAASAKKPRPALGEERSFWVASEKGSGYDQVRATLAEVSQHAYFFVENGLSVAEADLARSVADFEEIVFPSVAKHFGSVPLPGIDGDPRIYILISRLSGVSGYHSSADLQPRAVHPYSNEHEIIYVSANSGQVGSPSFAALLAHELQHLVRAKEQATVDNWINEGSSELAMQLAGFPVSGSTSGFLAQPDTQLNAWSDDVSRSAAHYGAAYLFMSYFVERYGAGELRDLQQAEGRGAELFDNYLKASGRKERFDDLFVDWAVANYVDDPSLSDGRFGYGDLDVRARSITRLGPVARATDDVSQYAARYYSLPASAGEMELTIAGKTSAPILPVSPPSGDYMWWSNRGDLMDSRLTLGLDLTGVDTATLRFSTWYDIEDHYDYAYVAVSTDGGLSWTTLPGRHTTADNPNGNSYGHGFTGRSSRNGNAEWLREEMDLTPYAGKHALLRFEYITDDTYNGDGFAVDDIEIPELGFRDGAEEPGYWLGEGFVRSDNEVPQRYAVRLIREGAKVAVEEISLDSRQIAVVRLPRTAGSEERLTLVVAAMAPLTTKRAPLVYSLQPVPTLTPTPR